MDFFTVLRNRHSVRAFEERGVDNGTVQEILRAMSSAPSAGDLQAYEVVAVRDVDRRRRLAVAAGQGFLEAAPVILVFFVEPERSQKTYGARGAHLFALQDATIAAAYAQLAAQALGLATVWVGAFDDAAVNHAVDAPHGVTPAALIAIGYAAETPAPTPRRPLDELVLGDSFR